MTIEIGGQQFSQAEVIAAIQQSNDAEHQAAILALQTTLSNRDATVSELTARVAELEAVSIGSNEEGNLLQAILTRLAAVESALPITRAGFGVTTEIKNGYTCYRVQVTDHNGQPMIVTFELPITTSSPNNPPASSSY